MEEILDNLGIGVERVTYRSDIIEAIKQSIAKEQPVIVWLNSYYQPSRNDTYRTLHWSQSVVVYGFDDDQKEFQIIELQHWESTVYKKRVISYEELEGAYEGYKEFFLDNKVVEAATMFPEFPSFLTFFEINNFINIENERKQYIENLRVNRESISNGFHLFETFVETAHKDELLIDSEYSKEWLVYIVTIINKHLAEENKLNKVNNEFENIIEVWRNIQKLVARAAFSDNINYENMDKISRLLQSVLIMEKEQFKNITQN